MTLSIRLATDDDHAALAALFRGSVEAAGPTGYSPEQVAAWAAGADDVAAFAARLLYGWTFVAEDEAGIAGFAGLDRDGYVTAVYVRGDLQRRGVGSALMEKVIARAKEEGIARLHSHASLFSQGLFERFGFRLTGTRIVERRGATFEQRIVERILAPDEPN